MTGKGDGHNDPKTHRDNRRLLMVVLHDSAHSFSPPSITLNNFHSNGHSEKRKKVAGTADTV